MIIHRSLTKLAACLAAIAIMIVPQLATAHVLITDETGKVGAIVHIAPDDDPVAGQISGLGFDVHTPDDISNWSINLSVKRPGGKIDEVPTSAKIRSVHGEYTFAGRGVYELELSLKPKSGETAATVFKYDLRISRGVTGQSEAVPAPFWAQAACLIAVWALMALAIIGYNRRHKIAKTSR
jgi:hypothetical protein